MDEKTLTELLKGGLDHLHELEIHAWPFPEEADKAFYVETADHKRYSVRVEEFARFRDGGTHY